MSASPSVLSGEFAGRYVIERELGRGATAIVYLARDVDHGRAVAIKVLRTELAETLTAERFLREIKVTAQLHHPHIVPVLASGEWDRRLYFTLPYMDGGTLRDRLRREKQLPIDDVVAIAKTILSALAAAHERNLLHRDVKPENILFTNGQACLSDFGIARAMERALDDTSTTTGLVRGTPAYMSPEQAAGDQDLDARSDLYAFACVMYEALAGVPAFVAATPQAALAQRITHEPRSIRVYRPSVPSRLEDVLIKALSTSPADRFQSADEFLIALSAPDLAMARHARPSKGGKRLMYIGCAIALVGAVAVASSWRFRDRLADMPVDTTQILILPPDAADSAAGELVYSQMSAAIGQWRGVGTVDRFLVREAAIGNGSAITETKARRLAFEAGAGRFIRSKVTPAGNTWAVYAALYDTKTAARLFDVSAELSAPIGVPSGVRQITDSLLLRGLRAADYGSRSLPAIQGFEAALQLINGAWDLQRADSVLTRVVEMDPSFGRASVWLAEVRVVNSKPATTWLPAAKRALALELPVREKRLASALEALGGERFDAACSRFDEMRKADSLDFISWFGLGQCRSLDSLVQPDPKSPSGWSFRSSRHEAVEAYVHAFKIAPALHRGVEAGGYRRLRTLLYAGDFGASRGFYPAADTVRFLARPEWSSDSLSFVPYPVATIGAGRAKIDPAARNTAIQHQRARFSEIATAWAAALPNNSGTKEALAIALEMSGNPAAVDTIRSARALARSDVARLRLAAQEVFLRAEFAPLADSTEWRRIRDAADSLLRANPVPGIEGALALSPVAALLGECRVAAAMVARAKRLAGDFVNAAIDSVSVLAAAGCPVALPEEVIANAVRQRLRTTQSPSDPTSVARIEYDIVGRALSLRFPADSARLRTLAVVSGDYLLRVLSSAQRGDSAAVAEILGRQRMRRGNGVINVSPDARLLEAMAWLAVRDTAAARDWLEPMLIRTGWLMSMPYEAVTVACQLRGIDLWLALAASGDSARVKPWSGALATLWAHADVAPRARAGRTANSKL